MKKKKKAKMQQLHEEKEVPQHRNRPLHIPLDFEKAIEGLLNVKPKKPIKS